MRGFPVSQQKVTGTVIQVPSSISTTAVWLGLFNLNWPSLIILYNMHNLQCSTFSLSSSTRLSWIVGCRSFFVQVPSLARLETGCLVLASIPRERSRDSAKVALRQPYSLKQALHRNPNHYTFLSH